MEPLYFDHVRSVHQPERQTVHVSERNECLSVGADTASDHHSDWKNVPVHQCLWLTAYRILSLTFMLWLTIIFVGWIIRQWRTFPLARISILTGAVLYTLLCVLPVSSLCRYYNLWAQTHGFLH